MSKCSALVNSREISKLAITYAEIDQEVKEKDRKKNAAVVIQSIWRGVLTRRKTKIMLKGFTQFQKLYRQKLQVSILIKEFKSNYLFYFTTFKYQRLFLQK